MMSAGKREVMGTVAISNQQQHNYYTHHSLISIRCFLITEVNFKAKKA